ncbi:MAG: FecR domain-containing protein [Bryobacterales bacterium]|nr:FecR domain-containing protein [Bryobacterales bacterium]
MDNKLDQAINQMKETTPAAEQTAAAGERVRQTLFGPGTAGTGRLTGCNDFRSLLPSYLQKTISDARRMLLEDHLKECVRCRRALDEARGVGPKVHVMAPARKASAYPRWAIAATVLVGLGTAGMAARFVAPAAFTTGPRATVESATGLLYRDTPQGSLPVGNGTELGDGELVRTASGAHAMLRLWDGSRVELRERAQVGVTTGWRGTTVRLERGHVLVQAAKQKRGHLFVSTGDSEVAVKGTIFSVNKGTLGSRVSVVEGAVEVSHNGKTESLKPGGQTTTSEAVGKVPVAAEITWSQDAARYMALLGEFQVLQQKWEAIPGQGLRYQSKLLPLLPVDAVLIAAIPNLGPTLAEGKRIFDERVRSSEVLRQWWQDPSKARTRQETEKAIDMLKDLGAQLGDEILFAVIPVGKHENFVLVAEAKSPNAKTVIDQLLGSHPVGDRPAYVVNNGRVIFSDNPARIAEVEQAAARGGNPATPFRQRVEQAYGSGAGWIVAANLEQILPLSVVSKDASTMTDLGLNTVQYLVAERREVAGKVENAAALSFSGTRRGIPAWLATPSAMTTLQFVSPDAGAVGGFVVKQPRAIVEEMFAIARRSSANFDADLLKVEQTLGIRIVDDLASALGAEMTVALDGPMLPIPSVKVAVEVNSPPRLQSTVERLVEAFNREAQQRDKTLPLLVLKKERVNNREFVQISGARLPFDLHYTFVDNYLLVAPARNLLTQAITNRGTGYTLVSSAKFRSLLPLAANPNFSGIMYHNIGGTLGPLADTLGQFIQMTPAQQQSAKMVKEAQPGLIVLEADAGRIRAATVGNFGGLNLGMLMNPEMMTGLLKH